MLRGVLGGVAHAVRVRGLQVEEPDRHEHRTAPGNDQAEVAGYAGNGFSVP